jgi:hypothetical protein
VEELEATFGTSGTKMAASQTKKQRVMLYRLKDSVRLSTTTTADPLTQRIRQQILRALVVAGGATTMTTPKSLKPSLSASTLLLSTTKQQKLERNISTDSDIVVAAVLLSINATV